MSALLADHAQEMGVDIEVLSAGTVGNGSPPIIDAVRMLTSHGLDVRDHLSRRLDEELVRSSDLIVTAEKEHVVAIAGRWPTAFQSTYTLPELVRRSATREPRQGRRISDWLNEIGVGRPFATGYLDDPDVGEIIDPTGEPQRTWDSVFYQIDELTRLLAVALK
jgi:protein-tyrosine-phosphatase